MNCTVCGNPLLFDRVVFHCSCGVITHAYCWDEHVLQAHKPPFDMGTVDLDGEFKVRKNIEDEQSSTVQVLEEHSMQEGASEEQEIEEQCIKDQPTLSTE